MNGDLVHQEAAYLARRVEKDSGADRTVAWASGSRWVTLDTLARSVKGKHGKRGAAMPRPVPAARRSGFLERVDEFDQLDGFLRIRMIEVDAP